MDELTLIALFIDEKAQDYSVINRSHGDEDFRETLIAKLESGKKIVIKVAHNSFTTSETIKMWQRCVEEYKKQGYYCPQIYTAIDGSFPQVCYKGRDCIAYAEEYSIYQSADQCNNVKPFREALYIMTAKIARERFSYADTPSGYCLFEVFPGDEVDEVTDNALDFYHYCMTLPEAFAEQTNRMFNRWKRDRDELEKLYFKLPFSVFQADFNDTNVLIDSDGNFVGVYDFNLAGKDEFLNYLFREIYSGSFEIELSEILRALAVASEVYSFSEEEIEAAPLIYRCIKPLWFTRVHALKQAGQDYNQVKKILDEMENAQIRTIDFRSAMKGFRRN